MYRVGLIILLFQSALIDGSPDFGLPADTVSGADRVLASVNAASSYVNTLAPAELVPAAITQSAFGLPTIVQILQGTGSFVSEDGAALALAMSNLATSSSGDPAALFDAVTGSIQTTLDHIAQRLPTAKSGLSALIGESVPDRLTDGFQRVTAGLQLLSARIGALKSGVLRAIEVAGSATNIPTQVLTKHVTVRMVYEVLSVVQDLRAYLPVIRYTLNTSLEDAVEADAFLTLYTATLTAATAMLVPITSSFQTAQDTFYGILKSSVTGLADFYTDQKQQILALEMYSEPDVGAAIDTMLAKYTSTLAGYETDITGVASRLSNDLSTLKAALSSPRPEIDSFTDSKVIGAMVHTLIDSGVYSRYCYQKHKDLVLLAIGLLVQESSNCIVREIPRLTDLSDAVRSLVATDVFDFEDVLDWLTICNELQNGTIKRACVDRIASSYKPLGDFFADKYDMLGDLIDTELSASMLRLTVCMQLSERTITLRYVPDVRADIELCAVRGPNA
uniref:Protein TsetseEP domain-containing protein n=1 Tax=Anopheles farauti TaxID=69004 RepID=A0A182QDW0_9DIPT